MLRLARDLSIRDISRGITMRTNEQTVRDFIAAWSRLDVDEIVAFFAPDGTYHNMMNKPVSGHDNLRRFIGGFIKDWTETNWDVLNIVSRGDIVMAERLDRTRLGAKSVDLPCCGVFELADGKIRIWRDYFDLATYARAIVEPK
ncbi:nuclear transport factor 2 family protein [Bradyrhizobium sediminis]|uniref:Nuclear transport factor 2 family protein n=1 Tax=Bradyrhizobium sediminis TaxID=2840469 RepID=A0A975NF29_9BRAD|nr:limonene-1,2-epoxide hydrolase family protein [Bradyrhizobium sediminis]QWG13660.1 nuclear transport factor 2 family protein [Bradyrhizobium sediminis]